MLVMTMPGPRFSFTLSLPWLAWEKDQSQRGFSFFLDTWANHLFIIKIFMQAWFANQGKLPLSITRWRLWKKMNLACDKILEIRGFVCHFISVLFELLFVQQLLCIWILCIYNNLGLSSTEKAVSKLKLKWITNFVCLLFKSDSMGTLNSWQS